MLELDGEKIFDQGAISNAFSNFFHGLMGTTVPSHDIEVEWVQFYPVDSRKLLIALEEPFDEEEIRRVIFSLGAEKAPVPDDFNMRFYQHFWLMLRQDFIDIFQAFMMKILTLSGLVELILLWCPRFLVLDVSGTLDLSV